MYIAASTRESPRLGTGRAMEVIEREERPSVLICPFPRLTDAIITHAATIPLPARHQQRPLCAANADA